MGRAPSSGTTGHYAAERACGATSVGRSGLRVEEGIIYTVVMLEARRFVIRGRVQGVGYRWFAQHAALAERLQGWVANREDGAVEVSAEGEGEALRRFEHQLRHGPPAGRVDDVIVEPDVPSGRTTGFVIRP
jgi:acylphosphatase